MRTSRTGRLRPSLTRTILTGKPQIELPVVPIVLRLLFIQNTQSQYSI